MRLLVFVEEHLAMFSTCKNKSLEYLQSSLQSLIDIIKIEGYVTKKYRDNIIHFQKTSYRKQALKGTISIATNIWMVE